MVTDSPDMPDKEPECAPIMPDSDVGVTDIASEPTLEMPDPAPEGASDEQSTLTKESRQTPELLQAYDCLQIHTPVQEFETYTKARLETLVRLGEAKRAEVTAQALELGLSALGRVMGAVTRETP